MKQTDYSSNSSGIRIFSGTAIQRRYDIDWLRKLALGILIIYYSFVSFQPWGYMIFFPEQAMLTLNLEYHVDS